MKPWFSKVQIKRIFLSSLLTNTVHVLTCQPLIHNRFMERCCFFFFLTPPAEPLFSSWQFSSSIHLALYLSSAQHYLNITTWGSVMGDFLIIPSVTSDYLVNWLFVSFFYNHWQDSQRSVQHWYKVHKTKMNFCVVHHIYQNRIVARGSTQHMKKLLLAVMWKQLKSRGS